MSFIDAEFFKTIAFLVVVSLTAFPVFLYLKKALAKKADKIAAHLYEAKALLKEAETLLKEAKEKVFYLHKEEAQSLEKAYKTAHHLEMQADETRRKRKLLKEKEMAARVTLLKESGLKEVRKYVISFAVDSLKETEGKKKAFFEKALCEMETVLSSSTEREKLGL